MKGIRPDAPDEAIAAILRALAPLLIYPITQVRKVTKRAIFFKDDAAPSAPPVALPLPVPACAGGAEVEPEVTPAEPDFVPEPVYPEMPFYEAERFAFALFVYLLMYKLYLTRAGPAPPMFHSFSPR